jgi:hypothetical protein
VVILMIVGIRVGLAEFGSATASPLVTQADTAGLTLASPSLRSSLSTTPIVREVAAIVPPETLLPDTMAAIATPELGASTETTVVESTDAPIPVADSIAADAAPADPAIAATGTAPPSTPVPVSPTATAVPPTPPPPTATRPPPTPTPVPPTATPTRILPTPTATMVIVPGTFVGTATPYSSTLAGNSMGCAGSGKYDPNDITVIAVGATQHTQFPCGTRLEVCGTVGCITGVRKDSCFACGPMAIDLSRSGFNATCGASANSCSVRIRQVT